MTGLAGIMILFCLLDGSLKAFAMPKFVQKAMSQYKNYAIRKIGEKSITAFDKERTSLYLSALSNDAIKIEQGYLNAQISLVMDVVLLVGAYGMMVRYSFLLTTVTTILFIMPIFVAALTGEKLKDIETGISARNASFSAYLKDFLEGFSTIKSFKAENTVLKLLFDKNVELEKKKERANCVRTILNMLASTAAVCSQLGVFLVGSILALTQKQISAGTVIVFVQLMNYVIGPMSEIPELLAEKKMANGLMHKLAENLNTGAKLEKGEKIDRIQRIVWENVRFGYAKKSDTLAEINFDLQMGKSYAVVGDTGSGKSTLLKLLAGMYPDYEGSIKVNEKEMTMLNQGEMGEHISLIQQNGFIFDATLYDNITLFGALDDTQLKEVTDAVCLRELIDEKGLDCPCGEHGSNLSGGEKQRVLIARALLKNTEVLLSDEISSALDAATSKKVMENILGRPGVMNLVVTHKLEKSLLQRYEKIFVLKDGRIIEQGTFDELCAYKNGYFYSLYETAQR